MAVKFIEQRKKQKYLILIFVAVLVITGLVLYFGFLKEEKTPVSTVASLPREIEIDFKTLNNPFLKELKPFTKILLFEGVVGKENPFLP